MKCQSPSMGRRTSLVTKLEPEIVAADTNGDAPAESPLTSAQKLSAATSNEMSPDPFGKEAKYFTETRVLGRDVGFPSLCCTIFSFST